jgi:NADH-quinone oxidoreductase subunit J
VNLYGLMFYATAVLIVASTVLAVTRRQVVHSVVFLVVSFLGSGMLFYLLGSPFLAALQVIIYAGAVMVLFLFVIMMLKAEQGEEKGFARRFWVPGFLAGFLFFAAACVAIFSDPSGAVPLKLNAVTPKEFGRFVFERYWLAVELISLLLFLGLVAAIHLGRDKGGGEEDRV